MPDIKIQDKSPHCSKPMLANRLFRGFSKKHNCWIYGDLIHTPEKQTRILNYTDTSSDGVDSFVTINELVDKESIGQCSGVFDKKAEDIFDGDILYFEGHGNHLVYFENGAFGYMGIYEFVSLLDSNLSISKVVGNIYENSELL
jgi:uncharacterized phage protein (TIGR01671 family)